MKKSEKTTVTDVLVKSIVIAQAVGTALYVVSSVVRMANLITRRSPVK